MADFVAVYGSLRRGQTAAHKMQKMEFVGQGWLTNSSLFALGWYPGIKLEDGSFNRVRVDIFKLPESERLREALIYDLDGYEGFTPSQPENSLFVRKEANIEDDEGVVRNCFVYEYNYPVNRAPLVENGDWNEHLQNAAP